MIDWKIQGEMSVIKADVVEWTSSTEGLTIPKAWASGWRQPECRRPEVLDDGSLRWRGGLVPVACLRDDEVQLWWGEKAEEALRECLDPDCVELGGFFEQKECEPDESMLGSWVHAALVEAVPGPELIDCEETTYHCNPAWAQERHNAQVFVAGGLHNFVAEWRQAGADSEVLSWLREGYHIKVGLPGVDSGLEPEGWQGTDKKNGGVARENAEDLQVVVMEVLKKRA
jgi:hypothetical protein